VYRDFFDKQQQQQLLLLLLLLTKCTSITRGVFAVVCVWLHAGFHWNLKMLPCKDGDEYQQWAYDERSGEIRSMANYPMLKHVLDITC